MTTIRSAWNGRRATVMLVAALSLATAGCAGSSELRPSVLAASTSAPSVAATPSATPTPLGRTLTGSLTMTSVFIPEQEAVNGCSLTGRSDASGYDDIHSGAQVTVTDQSGTIVGASQLGAGRFVGTHTVQRPDYSAVGDPPPMPEFDADADSDAEWAAQDALMAEWYEAYDAWVAANEAAPMVDVLLGNCVFGFVVADLADAEFLSVEVAHRGRVTYSRADLVTSGWSLDLSL